MIFLNAAFTQHFAPEALPNEVRTALGKPLRRAAALTQLALLGAFAALPAERRRLPTVLLWQSTTGPRQETLTLLDEAEQVPVRGVACQRGAARLELPPTLVEIAAAERHVGIGQQRLG